MSKEIIKPLGIDIYSRYLPYGLKFIYNDDMITVHQVRGIDHIFGKYHLISSIDGDAYPIDVVKPILRPIRDIVREIEHNKFKGVPIAEMFKVSTEEKKVYPYKVIENDHSYGMEFKNKLLFAYHPHLMTFAQSMRGTTAYHVGYQLKLFQMLQMWCFAYDDRTPVGSYININQLKVKVY